MNPTSANGEERIPREGVPAFHRDQDAIDRLRGALISAQIGVWEWDRETDHVVWDGGLEALFGLAPGGAPKSMTEFKTLVHPDERESVFSIINSAMAFGDDFMVQHRVALPGGADRWLMAHGYPIWDNDKLTGLIGVCRDVTVRRLAQIDNDRLLKEESSARVEADAARGRLEFILEASAAMAQDLDLAQRLDALSRMSIPRLADGSAVHLLNEHGEPELASLHHRDSDQVEVLRTILDRFPVRLDNPGGTARVIRTGQSAWMPQITERALDMIATSPDHLELLRGLDVTGALVVPLIGQEGPFGSVSFFTCHGRKLTAADVELVEELCARIAILVRNGQLSAARDAERAVHQYHAALLHAMFEASVDGILAVGTEGEVLAHNQRMLQLWGFDEALVEQGNGALLREAELKVSDFVDFVGSVLRASAERPARIHDQIELVNGRVLDRHGTSLIDSEGNYRGFVWSFRDITLERAQAAAILEAGERAATLSRTLQQSLLPPRLPSPPGLDLSARYHAAYEGLEVGGDFYDVFAVEDAWILVIGDVCGKGAAAAALTALARYTVRASAIHDSEPVSILRELNAAMVSDATTTSDGVKRFATVSCIRICITDEHALVDVACGGHPPPLILRADGRSEMGGEPGTLLGIFDEVELTNSRIILEPGDSIIAVTDGVLEARSPEGDMLEMPGVIQAIQHLVKPSASRLCRTIESRALEIQEGSARDDIAILIARFDPERA